MLKRLVNIIRENFIIIMCIIIFILLCTFIKNNYMDIVIEIDKSVADFFINKMIDSSSTEFMKNITDLGDYLFIGLIFITCIVLFKNKIISVMLSLDLALTGFLSVGLKQLFKRMRPINSLIKTPLSYSFPSGHTMFATAFYGLIIYFIWKSKIKSFIKYILTFIISMIIIFVAISRIYLGVHYFSDVVAGFIFGILLLILLINIFLNYNWRWKK